jgi:hypothetical protein
LIFSRKSEKQRAEISKKKKKKLRNDPIRPKQLHGYIKLFNQKKVTR